MVRMASITNPITNPAIPAEFEPDTYARDPYLKIQSDKERYLAIIPPGPNWNGLLVAVHLIYVSTTAHGKDDLS